MIADSGSVITDVIPLLMKLSQHDFDLGVTQCEEDVQGNVFRLYWQTRSSWGEYMTEIFAERFCVDVFHTSDLTTTAQSSFHAGYNSRIKQHIDEKFGLGAFDAAMDDVTSFRTERYQQQFPDER